MWFQLGVIASVFTFLATLVGFALYTHYSCAIATTATEAGYAIMAILCAMKLIQMPRYENMPHGSGSLVGRRMCPHGVARAPIHWTLLTHSFTSDIRTGPFAMCLLDIFARVILSSSSRFWYVSSCVLFLVISVVRPPGCVFPRTRLWCGYGSS